MGAVGVELAERVGLGARSVAIVGEGEAWRRLNEVASAERSCCIVVGHRPSAEGPLHPPSTAYGLMHHADRPVLLVPTPAGA